MEAAVPSSIPADILCSDGSAALGDHPYGFFYRGSPAAGSPFSAFTVFMLEFSFVVVMIHVVRFVLKPLRQPRIVAQILGGIIIGPSVLGSNRKFRETIFPETAQFIVRNVGIMGFMYFLFISGVKMDMSVIAKITRKKIIYIALAGIIVPMIASTVVAYAFKSSMDENLAKDTSIGQITGSISITSFPVLYHVLKEFNLLSSEIGRMALSVSICTDAIGMLEVVAFEAATQAQVRGLNGLWFLLSLIGLVAFMILGLRPMMLWIIRRTPEGSSVDQSYIVAILGGVLVIGFFTDMFGVAIANGPLWFGLLIPDGPPLGSTLVERSETLVMELLMPFAFACLGLLSDVSSMTSVWSSLMPLFYMVIIGFVTKLLATTVAALFFKKSYRDSIALALMLSLRGEVDLLLYLHWMDKKIVKVPSLTLMVLHAAFITAICTPLITVFCDPTKTYMVNKRRSIQHTSQFSELRIVICVHDQKNIASLINLLELSNPETSNSPFSVYVLHLVELIGRAAPVFIDHQLQKWEHSKYPIQDYAAIHNALVLYLESRGESVRIAEFTTISPMTTMHQDVCELAKGNKASLIILPFHKECLDTVGTEVVRRGVEFLNLKVLACAPCSVGIMVDKGCLSKNPTTSSFRGSVYNISVVFLGGADSREALALAERIAVHPDVRLVVIRFLSFNGRGDDALEKKLDDGVVTSFWVKNEANGRVVYREVVVCNGNETVAAIQAMNDELCDLWIVGRKKGANPALLEGLMSWGDHRELGVIGDYISSADFGSKASVLVVQQQVMRDQKTPRSPISRIWSRNSQPVSLA